MDKGPNANIIMGCAGAGFFSIMIVGHVKTEKEVAMMKKVISLIMVVILLFSLASIALAHDLSANEKTSTFSFYNENQELVTVLTVTNGKTSTVKVYVDGVLAQRAIADADTKTVHTEIIGAPETLRAALPAEPKSANGFISTISYSNESPEKIKIDANTVRSDYVTSGEPVDNEGLSLSNYQDGYYFLSSYGGFNSAPDLTGYLFRVYASIYEGDTLYWRWGAGETISAISAVVSLAGGPVSAVISVLAFTGALVLSYTQAVELETYTHHYFYRVRVEGEICFETERNITYWYVHNTQTGEDTWEEKRFNYGYTMGNSEMVSSAITYYLSHHIQ